ncbi:unnamed protein product [Linum tenue]|nr:unnamed protein product [Linum tenue]
MKIGKYIGTPIRVDHATSTGARSDYARVCVQVDLTKPLLSQFTIRGITYFIQYEGLEKICLQCGTYSDRECGCGTKPIEVEEPTPVPVSQPARAPDCVYGEWMIAKKKPRPQRPTVPRNAQADHVDQRGSSDSSKQSMGSRFNVLDVEEEAGHLEDTSPVVHPVEAGTAQSTQARTKKKEKGKHVPREPAVEREQIVNQGDKQPLASLENRTVVKPNSKLGNPKNSAGESVEREEGLDCEMVDQPNKFEGIKSTRFDSGKTAEPPDIQPGQPIISSVAKKSRDVTDKAHHVVQESTTRVLHPEESRDTK